MSAEKMIKKVGIIAVILFLVLVGANAYLFKEVRDVTKSLEENKVATENEFAVMENIIEAVQEEYTKKIEAVTKALEKIEKESNIKIGELEEELKNVNIKSGDFSTILNEVFEGVVSVVTDKGQGSGAFITDDGFIITNYHVVQGARTIRVVDYDKNIYAAVVNGSDAQNDIAILKINSQGNINRLTFTDSSKLKVGEKVVAVGNPAGLGFTATEGIISQVGRFATGNNPGLIQIDVPINPGNSGGPIINIEGNMVGIAKAKIAGYESLGFAIPANIAKEAAEQIMGEDF